MKKAKKVLALLLALAMVFGLAACGGAKRAETLVASIEQGLEGKFSPFFSLSQADSNVVGFVSLATFPVDRVGNPVLNGIEGETRTYNGTDYTYYAAANVVITENEDGTVFYDLTMRDDIVYSDGTKANIDDLIFGMYVVLDPTYDGNITMYSLPIQGLEEYRAGMTPLYQLLYAAGQGNTDFSLWSEDIQTKFWNEGLPAAGAEFAQSIVNYCLVNYLEGYAPVLGENMTPADIQANESLQVAFGMAMWGFGGLNEDGTAFEDVLGNSYDLSKDKLTTEIYWQNIEAAYDGLIDGYEDEDGEFIDGINDAEAADRTVWNCLDPAYTVGITTGDSAPSISGIQRTGDYSMRVVTSELDATAIYQLSMYIAPLAYYGDPAQYNYENNQFGFPKGDLSIVKSKTTQPLGAGPYTYTSYKNGTVLLEANPTYIYGEPKIKNFQLLETSEANKVSGLVAGTLDVADPSYSTDIAKQIAAENGLGEDEWETFDGKVLTTRLIDYLGYGYIGVNPNLVKVGTDEKTSPYSDASKNLRKAINTILAVYRDEAIDSYYGNTASVINYPISNTSWAAPVTTDDGYQIAYSKDVNGKPIYTADMTTEQKYEAALQAALGYLEAAGFTVVDGKVTAAPAGAKLNYQVEIGGGGTGDHPLFLLLQNASEALASIGIDLQINDHANASALYATYQNGTAEFWCAAWGSATDPDMFQLYHSKGSTNYYHISDAKLDKLIMDGRASTNQTYRKAIYQSAMEIILDYGVEVPMYQRSECTVFSSERVNINSLPGDMTPYWGWAAEIEKVELAGMSEAE